ncbi:transmembrane protein, putative [Bodo saltans]|uniref:Transmembrane protein, putative n=1 Tax=Bodo saltans TaxID=75058 RepID=A0A0S4J218_BODSA|nr:transmembrane protein, putative [Bodo saltans]|eukprot:CUG52942.1 transmembrane protein, putative [Bodo saltans]
MVNNSSLAPKFCCWHPNKQTKKKTHHFVSPKKKNKKCDNDHTVNVICVDQAAVEHTLSITYLSPTRCISFIVCLFIYLFFPSPFIVRQQDVYSLESGYPR